MSTFSNLEDVAIAYLDATENENSALFEQGDVIVNAVASGFNVNEVVKHLAGLTRRTSRTIYRRYRTADKFPQHKRNPECYWELHALAAATDNPDEWLAKAADEQWSSRQLKDAIIASDDHVDLEPEYVLDRVECTVVTNADGTFTVKPGQGAYVVTLMRTAESMQALNAHSQVLEVA